jgi:hypothetical protein
MDAISMLGHASLMYASSGLAITSYLSGHGIPFSLAAGAIALGASEIAIHRLSKISKPNPGIQ